MSKEQMSAYRYFYNLRKNHNMTEKDYQNMLIMQNGVCAICSKEDVIKKRLSVDHCHKTGKVRGLLCAKCNATLGMVKDNVDILKIMIEYLTI